MRPIEQAAHLYKMNTVEGYTEDTRAEMYRMSKSYVSAKIRAYKLMDQKLVPLAREEKLGPRHGVREGLRLC